MEFTTGGRFEVRITASDVGKRVSIRSLTGLPENGPSFTDTVGVLTSWADGVVSVTRRNGERVRLDEAALVSAKVVPPAPARRRGVPAAGARELQETAARGWPAIETERLGDWVLRASGGFTARANSVLPLGRPGREPGAALDAVQDWYRARGLPPRVQVTTGAADTAELLDAELERRGWRAERHALIRVAALAPLADREPDARVRLGRAPDAGWLSLYQRTGELTGAARKVLTGGPSVWFATVREPAEGADGRPPAADGPGGAVLAVGRCVVDGRWAGFGAVEVAPGARRRGLATAVMAELARRALAEGASAAYLQVETGNDGARSLYDGLGFVDHHGYHYRTAPGDGGV